MANTTIDILAQELQIKQRRLDKYRDKIYEQQDVLKDKIKRINELKELTASLNDDWKMCDRACDEKQEKISYLEGFVKAKEDKIIRLEDELKHAKDDWKACHKAFEEQEEELSYSRGEHPIQKAADRKRRNGKSKSKNIN